MTTINGKPKRYSGSMERDADGSYFYRGFYTRRVNGAGWVIRRAGSGWENGEQVAIRATRDAAGVFIDRRVFNEEKKRRAERGW